jgi:NTE family protein
MKKVGLALGSGAARGLSQIGILLWLKEHGIEVSCIAGTSIGSIIGAAISYGYTPEYLRDLALNIKWTDMVKVFRVSLNLRSFLEWRKIGEFMQELFEDRRIEDLKLPYACVASDIDTGIEYVFRSGPVTEGIRASACIPAIFQAVEVNGVHLVDGAVVNPVPVNVAFELGAEVVIGVNVNLATFTERMTVGEDVPASRLDRIDGRVMEMIDRNPLVERGLIDRQRIRKKIEEHRKKRHIIDVVNDTLAITSAKILSLQMLEPSGPVYFLRPDVGGYQDFDFDMAGDIIDHGYREAEEMGDELIRFCE